ncbi:MAG: signal peptidase I, partial [Candidatus Peregrinibacteria bacterium]
MRSPKKEKNPLQSFSAPRRLFHEAALFLLDILYNAIIIILLVVLIRSFLISPFRVIGSSMADTLASNEFILIDRLSYRLGVPQRGDAIVFRPPITNKYGPKFEETIT